MNYSLKSAFLAASLCVSTMACPWSFPVSFSSFSAYNFSIPALNFSKPACFSAFGQSVATKYNSTRESLHSMGSQVSKALDPQAQPSWNNAEVVQAGILTSIAFVTTIFCLHKYHQGKSQRNEEALNKKLVKEQTKQTLTSHLAEIQHRAVKSELSQLKAGHENELRTLTDGHQAAMREREAIFKRKRKTTAENFKRSFIEKDREIEKLTALIKN